MSRVELSWPGWGTFRIEPERGPTVVVDPCVSALLDDPHATEAQVVGDVVLLTHGHHEHIRDSARVARLNAAPFVAPPQVVDFLVQHRGIPRERFLQIEPDSSVELPGLRVTARSFPHLEKHDVAGKLGVLRRNRALSNIRLLLRHAPRIARAWLAIRGQPEHGPFLAYDLQFEGGPRIFLTCEAFTELLEPAIAADWSQGDRPIDLAVVGVESGQEEAAARLLDELSAVHAVAAAVHAPFERFYGKEPVLPARFLAGSAGREFWSPGDSAPFDL